MRSEENNAKNLAEADNADPVPAAQGNTMTAPAPLAPLLEQGAAIEQDAGNESMLNFSLYGARTYTDNP